MNVALANLAARTTPHGMDPACQHNRYLRVALPTHGSLKKPIKRWWPLYFRTTYKRQTGTSLKEVR